MVAPMAASANYLLLLLLLFLVQPWAGAGADKEAVICAEAACYTAHRGKLSAQQAQEQCSQNGGNLASVKTEEEAQHIQRALNELLKSEVMDTRMGKFWIGLQREKGKCWDPDVPLRGFSWLDGAENTSYANWFKEPKNSCIFKRCVSIMLDLSLPAQARPLPKWSDGVCGSPGSPGSNIEGFVCKFSFQGMCRPLALGGPGQVNYTTPFQSTSSSLEAVPFGSVANVACGDEGNSKHYAVCTQKEPDMFIWDNSGPLCVSSEYGCNFNNGGCQQDCFEGGDGSFRCGCRPGFRLLDDLVSCVSRNPCSSNPCRGVATCHSEPYGKNYTCLCPEGYQLDPSQHNCIDVDECESGSVCSQNCINTAGSFRCHCWLGYEPIDVGQVTCEDVDECATNRSHCAQGCMNTKGSFYCTCQKGYVLEKDSNLCLDVDECDNAEGTQPCDDLCINTQGSFLCGCRPGWELASDRITCIMNSTESPGILAGPSQRDMGDKEGSMSSATVPSPTSDSKLTSKVTPSTRRPSRPPKVHTNPAAVETLAPTGSSNHWMEPSTLYPTATTGNEESTGGHVVAKHSDEGTDGQKKLLFYILGTVVAILLLLALVLGLLVYFKRRAKRKEITKKNPQSATDSYSWAPGRAEKRTKENHCS